MISAIGTTQARATVLVVLLVTSIAASSMAPVSGMDVSRDNGGTYNCKVAGKAPTIDGTISAGEWSAANSTSITMNGFTSPGLTTTATWYFMNDHDNLFIAVVFTVATDFLVLDFDDGHDHEATNGGEDYVLLDAAYYDKYWQESIWDWSNDNGAGGTKDGSGKRSADRKVYEVSKPIDTADSHDMSAAVTETLGFRIETFFSSEYYRFPQNTVDHDLNGNSDMTDEMILWANLVLANAPPNQPPALSAQALDHATGNSSTLFTYTVKYTDLDNDTISKSTILISGNTFTMTTTDDNYTDGAVFTYTTTLSVGQHDYAFNFSDGTDLARLPVTGTYPGPVVDDPLPPTLLAGSVSPTSGTTNTIFRYKVTYTDVNNDTPVQMQVLIDGNAHQMSTNDTAYKDGSIFTFQTTLAAGAHTYHFSFSDQTGSARLPNTGESNGPTVIEPNHPPVLTNASVTPGTGSHSGKFTFNVTYDDHEGTPAAFVALLISDKNLTMSSANGRLFSHVMDLAPGTYNYTFVASDGEFVVRDPQTGHLPGPVVTNSAPVARIAGGPGPIEIKESSKVTLDAKASSDPDGDALTYEWASDLQGHLGDFVNDTLQLQVGNHTIILTVKDRLGLNDTETIAVHVLPLLPHVVVKKIAPSNLPLMEGQTASFNVTILNDGDADATGVLVIFWLDGKAVENKTLTLAAGKPSTTIKWTYKIGPGDHTLQVTAMGSEETITIQVAKNLPPQAAFVHSPSIKVNTGAYFDGSSSSDPEGRPLKYSWTFSDGTNVTGANVTHVFKKKGEHTVTLTVTDDLGNQANVTKKVQVQAAKKPSGFLPGFEVPLMVTAFLAAILLIGRRRGR